jgi:hypothetical protein
MKIKLIFEDETIKIISFKNDHESIKNKLFDQEVKKFCREQFTKKLKEYVIMKAGKE